MVDFFSKSIDCEAEVERSARAFFCLDETDVLKVQYFRNNFVNDWLIYYLVTVCIYSAYSWNFWNGWQNSSVKFFYPEDTQKMDKSHWNLEE